MSTRRSGLGRGLGALIPTAPPASTTAPPDVVGDASTDVGPAATGEHASTSAESPTPASPPAEQPSAGSRRPSFAEIPIDRIRPNARQPRQEFDESALAELQDSIREVGVLQPVVVRALADGYELVMGERRWRASRALGLPTVPAIIRSTDDDAMLRDALLENVHREQLNPLEEAAAYDQLLVDFGATHEELAARLGRSRAHVSNTIRLLGLPPAVQRRVAAGVLTAGHARAILALDDPQEQEKLAARIVAEGLSVRAAEEAVALGAAKRKAPARRRPRGGGAYGDVAAQLADHLDTRVLVDMGRSRGRITVDFAGPEDLRRILSTIAPGLHFDVPPAAGSSATPS